MPKYKLKAHYWDGSRLHPVGSVVEFEEGAAPKGSVLAKGAPEAEEDPKAGAKAAAQAATGKKA